MPWRETSVETERREFVRMARTGTVSMREACRRFGVSPTTGYLWAKRSAGLEGWGDRPRRPHTSPGRTPQAMEEQVCDVRRAHPRWGGRKIPTCSAGRAS